MPQWDRALITGASSGIGAAIASKLADEGTSLLLVGRDESALGVATRDLGRRSHVEAMTADLACDGDLSRVEERVASTKNPIDLLVNCAGFTVNGPVLSQDLDALVEMIDVNVVALVRLCHAGAKQMVGRGFGAILNISSKAAFRSVPGVAVYSGTKSFVNVFSRSLAAEVAPHGVRVSCVCPGTTNTQFLSRAGIDASTLRGVGEPEGVASVALASIAHGDVVSVVGSANARDLYESARAEWGSIIVREEFDPERTEQMPSCSEVLR